MNNNSTINSHSSPQYMNRWLSISRSSFMTVIHCYDSQLSLTTFLTFLFTLSFQLVNALDVWVLTCPSLHVHTICTCTCVWTHSSVVSSTVYMPTLCSTTLHHLTVSFTYTYAVTHPFHNIIKMMVYALFFLRFHVLMWFSLCCQCCFGRHGSDEMVSEDTVSEFIKLDVQITTTTDNKVVCC